MKKLWGEFVSFITAGNLLLIAIAFVLGSATKSVVDAFIADIVNPIIGAIVGKPEFTNTIKIGKGVIAIGAFITALVNLLIIGAVLFGIIKAYKAYRARKGDDPEAPAEDIVLLTEIRDLLRARQ